MDAFEKHNFMNFQTTDGMAEWANPDFLHSGGGGRGSTKTSTRSRKGRGGTADSNVRNKLDFRPNGSNWKKRKREEEVERISKGGTAGRKEKAVPRIDFLESGILEL